MGNPDSSLIQLLELTGALETEGNLQASLEQLAQATTGITVTQGIETLQAEGIEVSGAVHLSHPAGAEASDDGVVRDGGAGFDGVGHGRSSGGGVIVLRRFRDRRAEGETQRLAARAYGFDVLGA